jgi:hypothetical protein
LEKTQRSVVFHGFRYVDGLLFIITITFTNDLGAWSSRPGSTLAGSRPGPNTTGSGDVDARHRTHNRNHSQSILFLW